MIEIMDSKSDSTKFKILTEVAVHQPNVKQKEIASKIGVTTQAVSEYIKELIADGFISSRGRTRYRITHEGSQWVLKNAADMKRYSEFIMNDMTKHISTWTAIAENDLSEDEPVYLRMRDGLLYAGTGTITSATGITMSIAVKGTDVSVRDMTGSLDLEQGSITICSVPKSIRGGSDNVDTELLLTLTASRPYTIAIGIESLITLKRINIDPDIMFGGKESAVEAAFHGLSSLVVAIDEQVPAILSRLDDAGLEYELLDLRAL